MVRRAMKYVSSLPFRVHSLIGNTGLSALCLCAVILLPANKADTSTRPPTPDTRHPFLPLSQLPPTFPAGLTKEEQAQLRAEIADLQRRLESLRRKGGTDGAANAGLFPKAAVWALRYETSLAPGDVALIRKAL